MKKKKEPPKKPYRSLVSNLVWNIKKMFQDSPAAVCMQALNVPLHVGMAYAGIYLPSLVVLLVTEKHSLREAAVSLGLVMLMILLMDTAQTILAWQVEGNLGVYRSHITTELTRKSLSIFYQNFEKKEVRDLYNRALRATQQWDGVQPVTDLPRQMWSLCENVLCYLLFGGIISFVSPWLLLLLTLAPAVNWLAVRAYDTWSYRQQERWAHIDSQIWYISSMPGTLELAKDIRIYSMAGWLRQIYTDLSKTKQKIQAEQIGRYTLSRLADLVVILLRDSAAYGILIHMTLQGQITVDKFVLYFAAISSFAGFVGSVLNGWNALRKTSLQICDLREFLEYPEPPCGNEPISPHLTKAPEITLDAVSFRYDGAEADTLHAVSFTIHPGEKIALVGLNGAGKTTLVKLLCGLYKPTSGEIRLNGIPIHRFAQEDYYKLFSCVFQDNTAPFFSLGDITAARLDGSADYTRAEVCLRMAGLGDKIDALPQGIHTKLDKQLGKDRTELSGGETQKLMLARALYKDAPMLVLDEPTAALDPIAESQIYESYNAMTKEKSALFISHRLASTRFCDRILYLEDGTIVEEGTHEALLKRDGRYAKLYEIQSCWYREDYHKIPDGEEVHPA